MTFHTDFSSLTLINERMNKARVRSINSTSSTSLGRIRSHYCFFFGSSRSTTCRTRALNRVSNPRPISFTMSDKPGDSASRWSSGTVRSNCCRVRLICWRTPSTRVCMEEANCPGISQGAQPCCWSPLSVATSESTRAGASCGLPISSCYFFKIL